MIRDVKALGNTRYLQARWRKFNWNLIVVKNETENRCLIFFQETRLLSRYDFVPNTSQTQNKNLEVGVVLEFGA